jgi:hypothetical protein
LAYAEEATLCKDGSDETFAEPVVLSWHHDGLQQRLILALTLAGDLGFRWLAQRLVVDTP